MSNFFLLLGSLIVLGMLGAVILLPIIALVRFAEMRRRLQALEREVGRLRQKESDRTSEEVIEVIPAELVAEGPADVAAAEAKKKRPHPRPRPVSTGPDWSKLEAWLGLRGLGWAAVVLLLFTAAFFLKLVFERGWIDELGRVMIGVAIGTSLCAFGWRCYCRGQGIFAQMLTSAGIALLYLSTFATFGFYQLMPREGAAPFLVALVAEAFALAALYRAPAIAVMAVVGGLLNPLLLHSDRDQYRNLFTYLVILNGGVVVLSLFRRWWGVTTLALAGTHLLFWIWYSDRYHPAKLLACVLFHGAILALYLGQMALVNVWQKKQANIEELIRLLAVTLLSATAGYVLLDDDYHAWMGTFAVGFAIVFAVLATLVNRFRSEDPVLLLVLLALAMFMLAAVFPLQADAAWIAVGWGVQGLVLWWFGLRVRAHVLYLFGGAFLLLAVGRLLLVDTLVKSPHEDPFIPIFNKYGFPATVVATSLIAAALLQRRTKPAPDSTDFVLMRLLGLAGVVTLWIVLSIETYQFFMVQGNFGSPGVQKGLTVRERELPEQELQRQFAGYSEDMRLTAQMALSALWAVYALAQLAIGLRLQHRPLRWLALGLFALTLGKVMLVDTDQLAGMYRVGAFFALSLMMAAGAWAYQKLRHVLQTNEEAEHEPVA